MTGAHHEHGGGEAVDDTSTVVMGGFLGGLAGLVLQVLGYGGIPQTAVVAGATGIPGFIGGISAFFMCVVLGAN
eukprot:CAMPEP_0179277526 /NCGR_PEP_ID=MMETSP0797-20121207/35140_1 /TAXON_ID=47934 /ORGANISM="Dinophysis acuminata, Strain DAEP01" /LENGTH=73 /DNA_ID=CAMNT_0020986119 /DNA_START=44 /DNA_END=262 /DNA_ORIENTATION=-